VGAAEQPPEDVLAESAEVHERNLRIGVRLIAGSTIMFFFAFVFAYFYLRSLDSHGGWNAAEVGAPDAYGVAIAGLVVLSAASISYAARAARAHSPWIAYAGLALVAGLIALVVQGVEYANLGFDPQGGGYASVFYGWTIMFAVVALGALYWIETLVAEGLRAGGPGAGQAPPGLDEAAFYVRLLAIIAVIAWVILYLL
jgi:heme/copper-type cytochrome/quinol oxidase subunit 3